MFEAQASYLAATLLELVTVLVPYLEASDMVHSLLDAPAPSNVGAL